MLCGMPYRIAQGPLGTRALDALVDEPNACDLTMVRLKQLPPEVLARIGIPSSPELKGLEAWVAEEVANRYLGVGNSPREFARVEGKLMYFQALLIRAFGSLDSVANKTVLDLACGSSVPGAGWYEEPCLSVHPWMCRLVHHLGGHAIGVDIRPQGNERFEWYQADLKAEDSLSFLKSDSIDGYQCADFYDSSFRPENPDLLRDWDAWNQRLGTQLARVLRREAVIFSAHQPGLAFLGPEEMDPG